MNFTQPFIQDDRTRKYLAPVRIMWEAAMYQTQNAWSAE